MDNTEMPSGVDVQIGDIYFSGRAVTLRSILGSCISVCLYSQSTRHAGMNHILLPGSVQHGDEAVTRYGLNSMEMLLNCFIKQNLNPGALKAKIFGGASLHDHKDTVSVGRRNIAFVQAYLNERGIPIIENDTGGNFVRNIRFNTSDYKVTVKRLPMQQYSTLVQKNEVVYSKELKKQVQQRKDNLSQIRKKAFL